MGSSLIDIKKRITSTKKTSQITSAMQMVSASKLIKAEQKVKNYHIYANKIREIVTHIASSQLSLLEEKGHAFAHVQQLIDFNDLLIERPIKRTGYLIVSSDKGLAGSYNSSILKSTREMLRADHESSDEYVIISIGETLANDLRKNSIPVGYVVSDLSDQPSFDEVREVVSKTVDYYRQGMFDELYVCYNHHVNALTSLFRAEKMLPLTDLDAEEATDYEVEYLFEPTKEDILEVLLPQYAQSLIYGAIIDAKASEHASRMTAMKSATDNASDIIDELTVTYNQKRQTAITQEINEIVGGAQGLEN
ncbi:F0F1 ATP synthase subunit gamma [Jeotgalibaca sp. MA1X17-3]|uniref:F0F1 ATP synthase subunit gamma n=1 Tax=Jeotgalibaca sp. MA1X17-3 TaxID=2908211 RepID=UPI001F42BC8C|nr:F0F1 ATP synthase subunit gamma [Jeotgalibaca sp. MA1X17-3]UJF16550.1 F0F1 ATP synthase subunit gamma [Jeotgalibaca sp. MA1X17-3]